MISAVAFLTANDGFNNSFVSVFHSTGNQANVFSIDAFSNDHAHIAKNASSITPVNIFIEKNETPYVFDAESKTQVFNSKISTKSEKILNDLVFSLEGITQNQIKNASLFINEELVKEVIPTNNLLSFKSLNAKLLTGKNTVTLSAAFNENVTSGTIFRLYLNSPDDIVFNDKSSTPNTFYPIFGNYSSIVNQKN